MVLLAFPLIRLLHTSDMSYIAASYSQTLRVFKRVERIHTEMIEIVDELPDQDYTDVRKIRDKVDKLDTVLTYDIRLIKSVVQNQPFSLRFRGSNDGDHSITVCKVSSLMTFI